MVLLASAFRFYFGLVLLFGLFGLAFAVNMGEIPIGWDPHDGVTVEYNGADPRPQICWVDNVVVRTPGDPSIRLEAHDWDTSADPGNCTNLGGNGSLCGDANHAREVDGYWLAVVPGDNITISCWIRTNQSTLGHDNDTNYGARISMDYYDASYIELNAWDLDALLGWTSQNNYVPFNETDWQFRRFSVIVPAVINDTSGNPRTPTSFVTWVQVMPWPDEGVGWFADPYIEVNGGDSYTLELFIDSPINQVYNNNVTVSLRTVGNDTLDSYSWNVKYSNGTWLYGSNYTTSSQLLTINENATLTLYVYALGGNGTADYDYQQFTMFSPNVPEPEEVTPTMERGDPNASSAFVLIIGAVATVGGLFIMKR